MAVGLPHFLVVAALLFAIGCGGIVFGRRNVIVLFMAVEVIQLAAALNLVAFSVFQHNLTGQVFTIFVLTIAAAETAIGLAILVAHFRNRGDIEVESADLLRDGA